jgi:hypothetical protein
MRSRNQRSWETTRVEPAKLDTASSRHLWGFVCVCGGGESLEGGGGGGARGSRAAPRCRQPQATGKGRCRRPAPPACPQEDPPQCGDVQVIGGLRGRWARQTPSASVSGDGNGGRVRVQITVKPSQRRAHLVQQQQVAALPQHARQLQPVALAACARGGRSAAGGEGLLRRGSHRGGFAGSKIAWASWGAGVFCLCHPPAPSPDRSPTLLFWSAPLKLYQLGGGGMVPGAAAAGRLGRQRVAARAQRRRPVPGAAAGAARPPRAPAVRARVDAAAVEVDLIGAARDGLIDLWGGVGRGGGRTQKGFKNGKG